MTKPKLRDDAWTPQRVRDFWATLVIRKAVACGSGTSSKDFAAALQSTVTGLGKRISKLERDSKSFDLSLPLSASLGGPNGEKEVQVDPVFSDCFKELSL